jgi:hypothetical protein
LCAAGYVPSWFLIFRLVARDFVEARIVAPIMQEIEHRRQILRLMTT